MVMAEPFVPTHRVPAGGLSAWNEPDPTRSADATLDAGLEVRVLEQRADGWARVLCSNQWSAWTDGRRIVGLEPRAGTGDDMLAVLEGTLGEYGRLLDDLAARRLDADTFRRKAFEIGLVVRDDTAWLVDLQGQRVHRYDGLSLQTLELPARAPDESSVED
jgi:hypothetical protein